MRESTTEQACGGHPSSQRTARASRASAGQAQHHGRSAAGRRGVALRTCRRRAKGLPAGAWVRLGEQRRHCLCKPHPVDTVHSPRSQHNGHGAALRRPKDRGGLQTPAPLGLRCWYRPSWTAGEGSSGSGSLAMGGAGRQQSHGRDGGAQQGWSGMAKPGTGSPAQPVSARLQRGSPDATSKVLFNF